MSTTTSGPGTETPKRAAVAAAIAVAGHALVLLAAFVAGRVVRPSAGGGIEDLAAVAVTFLGGEVLIGLACVVTSMVLFRRGWRYTGVGLMGGWIAGLVLVVLAQAVLS